MWSWEMRSERPCPVECGQITREEEAPQLIMYSYRSLSSEVFLQTRKKENWVFFLTTEENLLYSLPF